MGISDQRRKKT